MVSICFSIRGEEAGGGGGGGKGVDNACRELIKKTKHYCI